MRNQRKKRSQRKKRNSHAKRFIANHTQDSLDFDAMLYPIFATEAYRRSYEYHDRLMIQAGLDAIQRSYQHMQVRQDIIKKLQDNPHRYDGTR